MSEKFNVEEIFAENVFTLTKMKEYLPKKVFAEVKNVMEMVANCHLQLQMSLQRQ